MWIFLFLSQIRKRDLEYKAKVSCDKLKKKETNELTIKSLRLNLQESLRILILQVFARGGVMLFDDITWSEGMKEAWREILASKAYTSYENFERMGALWI